MSITRAVQAKGRNKLVIPSAGKMFKSNISKSDRALCFCINKGYFESESLSELLCLLDDCDSYSSIIVVGKTEKVRLSGSRTIVYRQRVFFKSLIDILNICKLNGFRFDLSNSFRISINNVLNCVEDLVYLEVLAARFGETIDTWLTNCCIIHLSHLLLSMDMYSNIIKYSTRILHGKEGYLDRAPFLISSYSIDNSTSGLFLGHDIEDKRLYSMTIEDKEKLVYGFTDSNIASDIKGGTL